MAASRSFFVKLGRVLERGVEHVEGEVIVVHAMAGRRGGPAVTDRGARRPGIEALQGTRNIPRPRGRLHPLRQSRQINRHVIDHPVHPRLGGRSVRIVADQGQFHGPRRQLGPRDRRRQVLTVARMLFRNPLLRPKRAARGSEVSSVIPPRY